MRLLKIKRYHKLFACIWIYLVVHCVCVSLSVSPSLVPWKSSLVHQVAFASSCPCWLRKIQALMQNSCELKLPHAVVKFDWTVTKCRSRVWCAAFRAEAKVPLSHLESLCESVSRRWILPDPHELSESRNDYFDKGSYARSIHIPTSHIPSSVHIPS
jgi:hypothetical protein